MKPQSPKRKNPSPLAIGEGFFGSALARPAYYDCIPAVNEEATKSRSLSGPTACIAVRSAPSIGSGTSTPAATIKPTDAAINVVCRSMVKATSSAIVGLLRSLFALGANLADVNGPVQAVRMVDELGAVGLNAKATDRSVDLAAEGLPFGFAVHVG